MLFPPFFLFITFLTSLLTFLLDVFCVLVCFCLALGDASVYLQAGDRWRCELCVCVRALVRVLLRTFVCVCVCVRLCVRVSVCWSAVGLLSFRWLAV